MGAAIASSPRLVSGLVLAKRKRVICGGALFMKKEDIVNELSKYLLDKKQAKTAVDQVFAVIKKGLDKDGKVTVSNFGTFKKVTAKAVTRHNPKTLEKVTVPAKTKVRFKASPKLV